MTSHGKRKRKLLVNSIMFHAVHSHAGEEQKRVGWKRGEKNTKEQKEQIIIDFQILD